MRPSAAEIKEIVRLCPVFEQSRPGVVIAPQIEKADFPVCQDEILDETDSGLDVDAVKTVSAGIKAYREQTGGSLLIITHNTKILEALTVDKTHIIADGKIAVEGGAELIDEISANGFEKYI